MTGRFLLAALVVAGCTQGAAPVTERPIPERGLTGQTWVLDSLGGERVANPVTATFADGQVTGVAPCNSFVGAFEGTGRPLRIGPLAATRRACPELALENRFLTALGAAAEARFTAAQMELLDADGRPLMVFIAAS
jgi:heat shock protein HslJ